jgi:hypothetical protein
MSGRTYTTIDAEQRSIKVNVDDFNEFLSTQPQLPVTDLPELAESEEAPPSRTFPPPTPTLPPTPPREVPPAFVLEGAPPSQLADSLERVKEDLDCMIDAYILRRLGEKLSHKGRVFLKPEKTIVTSSNEG